ncbi:MucR family transcriptional regulator [Serinicoccus sp. CNJ-927]|uniref:MucR family transcriptional regulator n=1 Tax=Serinicoccus sp. CNJ-927 TaxID=1904970 RepID=UPI00096A858A
MASRVGDPDGFGHFGIVDSDPEGVLCHECGRRFAHLGLHAWRGHGITADQYREQHGLPRKGLVADTTARSGRGQRAADPCGQARLRGLP